MFKPLTQIQLQYRRHGLYPQANQFDDFWEKASRKHQERVDEQDKAKSKNKLKKGFLRGNNHELEPAKIIPPASLEELKEWIETENNGFMGFRQKKSFIRRNEQHAETCRAGR